MPTVEEIRTDKGFYGLRDEWNELLLRSKSNVLFLTWDWLYNWWKCFKDGKELMILLIRDGYRLKGIAPFFLLKNKVMGGSVVKFLGSTSVGSDYLDFIIEDGNESEVLFQIRDYLNARKPKWRAIELTDIPAGSKTVWLIHRYCNRDWYLFTRLQAVCPYVHLPSNYESYLKSLSPSMRYNIKRKRNKFENKFDGEFTLLKKDSEFKQSFNDLVRLNTSRMRERSLRGPFQDKLFSEFHRNMMWLFFKRNWLRLCFLKIGSKPIASMYTFAYGGKYYYYQAGFDPQWAKLSPGFLLFSYCIENAILEGAKEFDFLRGDEEYKFDWAKEARVNLSMTIYRSSFESMRVQLSQKLKLFYQTKIIRRS